MLLRATGELLLTLGVVVFLFIGYTLYGTGLQTSRAQADLKDELAHRWTASPAPPQSAPAPAPAALPGAAVALLRVPLFGDDYEKVVVEGTDREALKKGPGHQPGTGAPGQVGNFVLAGHRTTYGAPFSRLGELALGDEVVVESREAIFTYRIRQVEVVDPSDVAVMLPVPGLPGVRPTEAVVTLITCTPKYSARQRLVLTGSLVDTSPRR